MRKDSEETLMTHNVGIKWKGKNPRQFLEDTKGIYKTSLTPQPKKSLGSTVKTQCWCLVTSTCSGAYVRFLLRERDIFLP